MSDAVLVALITGGLGFVGAIVSGYLTYSRTQLQMDKQLAVMNTKIEALTEEVRKHNGFAEKIPVLQEQVKILNHRIDDVKKGA